MIFALLLALLIQVVLPIASMRVRLGSDRFGSRETLPHGVKGPARFHPLDDFVLIDPSTDKNGA